LDPSISGLTLIYFLGEETLFAVEHKGSKHLYSTWGTFIWADVSCSSWNV